MGKNEAMSSGQVGKNVGVNLEKSSMVLNKYFEVKMRELVEKYRNFGR